MSNNDPGITALVFDELDMNQHANDGEQSSTFSFCWRTPIRKHAGSHRGAHVHRRFLDLDSLDWFWDDKTQISTS
jgi:hypothetical protein